MGEFLKWYFLYLIIASLVNYVKADELHLVSYVSPLSDIKITSVFGDRVHPIKKVKRHHAGVDLRAAKGTPVRALLPGKIVFAGEHGGYGKLVSILHAHGVTTHYAHLSSITAKIGQDIWAGQILGKVGSTGISTGPHLHFEVRKNGIPLDPLKIFESFIEKGKG